MKIILYAALMCLIPISQYEILPYKHYRNDDSTIHIVPLKISPDELSQLSITHKDGDVLCITNKVESANGYVFQQVCFGEKEIATSSSPVYSM